MSKISEITWEVPLDQVQIGINIGYTVEFSQKSYFSPILYRLSTCDQITESAIGTFFYSLDNGVTWLDYPIGEQGMAFTTAYKMKIVISSAVSGYLFTLKNGTVSRISADGSKLIENYTIGNFESNDLELDSQNNLYVTGQNKTCYKIDVSDKLRAGNNSLNLHSNPLGIGVDRGRNTFWQIDKREISLKDLNGNLVFSLSLPFDIDTEISSSSSISDSSSYSSSSSSSSFSSSSSTSSTSTSSSISSSSISSASSSSESLSSISDMSDSSSSTSSSTFIRSSSSTFIRSSSSTFIRSSSSSSSSVEYYCSNPVLVQGAGTNLSGWTFTGMSNHNSDAGQLYLVVLQNGLDYDVYVFKHASMTLADQVAFGQGSFFNKPAWIVLDPNNNSALSGQVYWDGGYSNWTGTLDCFDSSSSSSSSN